MRKPYRYNIDNLLEDVNEESGVPPYTRGIYPEMYSTKLWTMRQYAGFGSSRETNERFKYLISQGQTGLSVAFDLPTQLGYDSDHELSKGEVGRVGVAIDTLKDMEMLFKDIPLDDISVSMTINSTAIIIFAMYLAMAQRRGLPLAKLRGTIQNDILKEYTSRGTYIYPPDKSLRLVTDIFSYCKEYVPKWNTISISGYHIREAGATAIQEIAFTLSNGVEYVLQALQADMSIDEFAPRLSFFFSSDNGFFEEIAKFRAARRVWYIIMEKRFHAKLEKSKKLRFHTQTGGSTLTAQQPMNNIIRVTIQAMSAILGGTQSLHTNSYDEALGLPSEDAVKIALRTQQILAYESGIPKKPDPVGGSYYVEELTNNYVKEIIGLMNDIEERGGVIQAIENGYIQNAIQSSAYQTQLDIENQKKAIVGLNLFNSDEKKSVGSFSINRDIENEQIESLNNIKNARSEELVKKTLKSLKRCCRKRKNLMPAVIDAVSQYATIGEISNVFREEFGEYVGTQY